MYRFIREGMSIVWGAVSKSVDEHFFNWKVMDTEEALSIFNLEKEECDSETLNRRYKDLSVEGGSPYIAEVIRSAYQFLNKQ